MGNIKNENIISNIIKKIYIKLLSDVFFFIYMIKFKEKKCMKPKSQKVK